MITLDCIAEAVPGAKWAEIQRLLWPGYRAWFRQAPVGPRPTFLEARRMLREHMPELVPTWEALVDLSGGGDEAARFLAMWCPPPYIRGCSQLVWPSSPPMLARNYDYAPELWDAVLWRTQWLGMPVVAMTDSLWGVLDGVNDAGLAVSLAFGGRSVVGPGFGMPLILRYVLETCETTAQAVAVLGRVPTHMAYNVTALDQAGAWATVYTAPDRAAEVTQDRAATNHQAVVDWPQYVEATLSRVRLAELIEGLGAPNREPERSLADWMLRPPLYRDAWDRSMGTLYTAVYEPAARAVRVVWPELGVSQSIATFREQRLSLPLPERALASRERPVNVVAP